MISVLLFAEIGDPGESSSDRLDIPNIQNINTLLKTETQNTAALESRIDPTQYKIGPGDQILIMLTGNVVINYRGTVDPFGKVMLPMIKGEVIGGLNVPEAQRRLKQAYSEYFHDFDLSLSVTTVRQIQINVSGHIYKQGLVTVPVYSRLTTVLALSLGIFGNGSYRKIRVIRENGQTTSYDLRQYFAKGDTTQNPTLAQGDRIFVPKRTGVIKIRGDIYHSFEYERMRINLTNQTTSVDITTRDLEKDLPKFIWFEILGNEKVEDILQLLGDSSPTIKGKKILIRRYTKDGFKEINADLNTVLQDRDELLINTETSSVFVYGNVNTPGEYDYLPNKPAIYYINKAGGATSEGDMKRLQVLDKKSGKYEKIRVDEVVPEDTHLYVPPSTKTDLKDYLLIISTLISVIVSWQLIMKTMDE